MLNIADGLLHLPLRLVGFPGVHKRIASDGLPDILFDLALGLIDVPLLSLAILAPSHANCSADPPVPCDSITTGNFAGTAAIGASAAALPAKNNGPSGGPITTGSS